MSSNIIIEQVTSYLKEAVYNRHGIVIRTIENLYLENKRARVEEEMRLQ